MDWKLIKDPSTRTTIIRLTGGALFVAMLIYGVIRILGHAAPDQPVASNALHKNSNIALELNEVQVGALKIEAVTQKTFTQEKRSVGTITFDQNKLVTVFAHYQGRLIEAHLNIGDSVQLGQPLFTMQSPDLLTAEANLITVAGTSSLHSKTLVRAKTLVKNGGISQQAADQVVADQQSADGALKSARDNVRIFGKTEDDINKIISERSADSTLVVTSPISGVVTARAAAPGLYVQPGVAPAPYTIADTSTMWMVANVIENDAPLLQVGQEVSARVAAFPDRNFKGKIIVLGANIDPNTRRVFARIEIQNSENLLRAGMFATFVISTGPPLLATSVPQNALVREMDGSMSAWTTIDKKKFIRKTVVTGMRQNNLIEIKSGLKPGMKIVSDGAIFLSNQVAISAME